MEMDNFMKIRILFGLCVALGASFISVRADDNPAQAAARVALEQKLNDLDHPQTQPPPATNTPSGAVVVQPAESATNVTGTVPAKTVTPQTALAATTQVAAPAAATPAATAPAVVARAPVASAMSLLLLSLLLANLVALLILIFRQRCYRPSPPSESSPSA
jgi:hypothetical protein